MASKGNGYLGSNKIETSVANKEIIPIPSPSKNWTNGYNLYKFSFNNEQDCTVIINKEATIFLKAGQGFEVADGDKPVSSFVIKENNIKYNWIGGF